MHAHAYIYCIYNLDLFSSTNLAITISVFLVIQAGVFGKKQVTNASLSEETHKTSCFMYACSIISLTICSKSLHALTHFEYPMGSVGQKIALSTRQPNFPANSLKLLIYKSEG